MQDFVHTREEIDTLIDEVRSLLQKKSVNDASDRIKQAREILHKLKLMATNEQHGIVAKRVSILDALAKSADTQFSGRMAITEKGNRIKLSGRQCCIYAIKAVKDLNNAYKNGKKGMFIEDKPWSTGLNLCTAALNENTYLPVVFADAGSTWELLYWAKLTNVEIFPNTNKQSKSKFVTRYSFQDMRQYPRRKPPYNIADLILDSTGEAIKKGYIKSYAICRKPECLR